MKYRRLLSGTFAFIVGIIGLIGLLLALSLPVSAQPNADWPATDPSNAPLVENLPSAAIAIEPVEAPISLPPLDWPATIPPTHSLPYRRGGSSPAGVARSSAPPAYLSDGPHGRLTGNSPTDRSAPESSKKSLAAPDVNINKWNPSGGYARPGGVMVYDIQYSNWGDGDAENTIITDTLPLSTTYAGDNSGVTPEIGSDGVITWNLGTLIPNTDRYFMVTLDVSAGASTIPDNCAGIATTSPGDLNPDNNRSCTGSINVQNDDVEISVDKWPNPNDPAPGEEFEYTLQVCNNRGAAAGPVWLTDTLPLSTTLVRWWPEDQWNNYWTEVSRTGGQLVLYAPGLSGNLCDHVHARLQVDAGVPYFTSLTNSIVAAVEGDVDLNNNQRTNTIRTSPPRYDVNLNKNTNNGVMVPGGWIDYHISYYNQGNSPVHAWVTDTLPAGTAYQPNSAREQNGGPPFPPTLVAGQTVVWDLGTIGVSQGYGFDFSIDISSTLEAGTVLTNCATIGLLMPDDSPWDNTSCASETIHDHGPNLRVIKWSNWENNYRQLRYDAQFQNVGDQQIDNVWITDTLPALTTFNWWKMDFDWGRLISNTQSGNELRWEFSTLYPGDNGWLHFGVNLDNPDARPGWYTNTIEIDTPAGDATPADNHYLNEAFSGEVNHVELRVANRIDLWGQAQPNSPLTITTPYTEVTAGVRGDGNWNIYQEGSSIQPGDTVTVTAGDGTLPVVIHVPDPFNVQADSNTDRVWGQIAALDHQSIEVDLYGYLTKIAQTDGSGYFTRSFADVPRGGNGEVRYYTTIDSTDVVFHRDYQTPDLLMNVNYGDNWIEGNYEVGHTVWITVAESNGVTLKGTAVLTTGLVPWWGGGTGFSTNWQGWSGGQPDIVPGDWVYGALDNGYTSTVHVGTINGWLDASTDSITGTLNVPWFAQLLDVECNPWGAPSGAPQKYSTAMPDGSIPYSCQWNPTTEWDILPGQNLGVLYREPDGDQVFNSFHVPSANLWINKWREGGGEVAPGGAVVYGIRYANDGEVAGEAILTDTLPANTTYITDSSGLPVFVNGSVITWNLGSVQPMTLPHQFYLVVTNSADVSDTLHNQVDIGTQYDSDWNNNHAEADVHVNTGRPDLWVNKNPNPGDPTPGQNFDYDINYGNNNNVASGPVWLTDTLPPSTTLVSWVSNNHYNLWTQVSAANGQVVLYVPSVPGNYGDQIILTLHLDANATYGTQLTNTVEITTTDDTNPDNNRHTHEWTWVNPPRYGVSLNKDWGHGSLVPGQHVNYWLHFNNNGNMPAPNVVMTDVLPSGVVFVAATRDVGQGNEVPYPPTSITGNVLRWDVGSIAVAENQNVRIEMAIPPTLTAGTVLTNCAEIATSAIETDPYDNASCTVDTVRAAGPNLRVVKFANWNNPNRVRYDVQIANIGSQTIQNVHITDTLPISMSVSGWGVDFWEQWTGDQSGNQITLTLTRLEPNWTTWLHIDADVPNVPNGTFFTNTARIDTPPGDVYPQDNTSTSVIGTGPDLTIAKWQSGGAAKAGQLLTYTLHFKNDSQWQTNGHVWVTDTLPAGVQFVSAQQRDCWDVLFCDATPYNITGRTLTWDYGRQWCNGCWNDLIVTVRVTDTARFGDVLTNMAMIASDDPNDIEPNYANNTSTVVIPVIGPEFVVGKAYQGNRVAGTVVTYTLTVTNQGNYTGTNVRLIDWTPDWFTYGGGGSYGSGLVTWTLPSILPDNGTASRWFSGTLSCTSGGIVTNQYYRVDSSDQGVTSTDGISVSFVIAAPAINTSITRSPGSFIVSDTVRFTATASTDGTPLGYAWNFGDGSNANGLTASHVYTHDGIYTAIFTATDACNFTRVQTSTITVNAPTINANFNQSATSVVVNSTVRFTDTSTTNLPPIVAWGWNFGDGSLSTTQNPTHTYTTIGSYTVTLLITDSLGYTATHSVVNAVIVQPACTSLTNVAFTYAPAKPLIHGSVAFTATIVPISATPPITYAWSFGDGSVVTITTPTVQHTYHVTGTQAASLTAYNVCTPLGVSAQNAITIAPYRIFLPLAMRNH